MNDYGKLRVRPIKPIYILLSCYFLLTQTAQAENANTTTITNTECLGRSLFDINQDTSWHLLNDQWDYTDRLDFATYTPDIRLEDKELNYGSDPTNDAYSLVTIDVSPKTTFKTFKKLVDRHSPSVVEAKERVIKNKIEEISVAMTGDLSRSDPDQYKSLEDERDELREKFDKLGRATIERVLLPGLIAEFKEQKKPTEKLELELETYQKEFDSYPTDELYAEQSSFEFGMPNAYGARHPHKLIVLLWRDERVYRFAFGQQSAYSRNRSSFEKLLPAARDLLARFRTRAEFEIPKETGFCLPFGFIADDGKAHYSITMAWHPTDNPNLLYSLSLS
ncbi:hypothetical protein M5G26_29390, partial [Pseudomonas sp. TNT2022 ID642]|nr:hypothetical protein [Pseudomonas sp. TNT2022 ID642]